MNRLTVFPAVVALAFTLTGCGKSNKDQAKVKPVPQTTEETTPTTSARIEPVVPNPTDPNFFPGSVIPPAPIITTEPMPATVTREELPMPMSVNPVVAQNPNPNPIPVPKFPPAETKTSPEPTPMQPMTSPTTSPSTDPNSTPKPYEYPKSIDGRDIAAWLRELAYDTANIPIQRDAQTREIAIKVLPAFGPSARKPALDPLIRVVQLDPDPNVRMAAVIVISNMGNEDTKEKDKDKDKKKDIRFAKSAISALRTRLAATSSGSPERLHIVRALSTFGPDAINALPELRTASRDASYETRIAVAQTLGRIGMPMDEKAEPNDQIVTVLMTTIASDTCASARMEAIQSLLMMGPPKPKNGADLQKDLDMFLKPVVARLKPEMGKSGEKDRCVLSWLLVLHMMYDQDLKVHEANAKQIASFLRVPDAFGAFNIRLNALNALAVLGPKGLVAIDDVIDALAFDDVNLVAAAISTLATMGTGAVKALPHLEKIKAGSKDEKRPANAPKDWKPDPALRNLAGEAIEYIKGTKKLGKG